MMSSLCHIQHLQEERKNATEQVGEAEVSVTEVGVVEEGEHEPEEGGAEGSFVNLPSLKPDAALVPHHAAALVGTQPTASATPSVSPQSQSLAAPPTSMVS